MSLIDRVIRARSLKAALDLGEDLPEALYTQAFRLANHGQAGRAAELFFILCAIDDTQVDYWLGLGSCLRALQEGVSAMEAFDFAARLAPHSAAPQFHRLVSLVASERWDEASEALATFDRLAADVEDAALITAAGQLRSALDARSNLEQIRGSSVPDDDVWSSPASMVAAADD